ncbi:unnamed protein product [Heligmosomoides polygyrus]|uniref:Dynactin subunit 4 n=1 Tax=Heligmosomoides polygyrus TaxID=6339 RepID=A0A183FTE4_HELPZ|nr:unnamed protein product [Heligmosomoides polygyrus]
MRVLAAAEKAQRDQVKLNKRRSHNVGSFLTDRYGLQAIYQKRKKTFEKPVSNEPLHLASEEVPELDMSLYLEDGTEVIEPSLDSRLRQPLAAGRLLRPVRMPLKARRAVRRVEEVWFTPGLKLATCSACLRLAMRGRGRVRYIYGSPCMVADVFSSSTESPGTCKHCDHNLVKLEYGTSTIRYKIQYFARNFVPEIRLSREPQLLKGQNGSVLLTVANESNSKAEVIIMADNEDGKIECLTPVVELSLPSSDDTTDIYDIEGDRRFACDGLGTVVFRRRHRAGIRLEVNTGEHTSGVLSLLVKFKNEQCSMNVNTEPDWKLTRVHIALSAST